MYVLAPRGADTGHQRDSVMDCGKVWCAEPSSRWCRVYSFVFHSISFTVSLADALIWGDGP